MGRLVLATLSLSLLMASCSTDSSSKGSHGTTDKTSSTSPPVQPGSGAATSGGTIAGSTKNADGSPASGTTPTPSDTTTPTPSTVKGEAYFTATILPVLNTNCASCHAEPAVTVPSGSSRGPLTIFSYAAMAAKLADGNAPMSNGFYNKTRNLVTHSGGDRCVAGPAASPCKEFIAWWTNEFGATPTKAPPSATGLVTSVSDFGRVYGYSYNPADLTATTSVAFYIDGPMATGNAAGTAMANLVGDDANMAGDHAFAYDLPVAMRDGKQHSLYAYSIVAGTSTLLTAKPVTFTSYAFTTAGRAYFDSTVKPKMNGCTSCHTVAYEQQFYILMQPTPAKGATALNNTLINKPSQTNNTRHGGGQRCASATAEPCASFQAWWKIEAGQ